MADAVDPLARLDDGAPLPAADRVERLDRVVIAGGGPTGLCAALALARLGVPVTVLEKGAELSEMSRASTLHPPTLELLDDLGVIEPVLQRGLKAPHTQFRDRRLGPVATFDLGVLSDDTAYPFRVQLEQNKLAAIVAAELLDGTAAGRFDVDLRMSHRCHGVYATQGDAGWPALCIGTAGGFARIESPWVIAADGAHSAIRSTLGIALLGDTYPEQFLVVSVADALHELLPDLASVNYVADPDEWLVLLRTPDHWRVLFPISADDVATAEQPAEVQRRLDTVLVGSDAPAGPRQWTVLDTSLYVVSRRVAATMRCGRVLIAGDAAHQNSPLGGMGMNSGIQDAVSAARRLAEVWHASSNGQSVDDSTLDEYDRLRREVATEYVQADSHANWLVLREPDHDKRAEMQTQLRTIAADPVLHRQRMRRTAMLDAVRDHL